MEDVLHGYDVLPSAVHLTASTLALLAPEIAFKKMQLYSLPLGKMADDAIYLGSIEFLGADKVQTQLNLMGTASPGGAAGALSGAGTTASEAPLPKLDLCVMNPPFVRSVGGNLLFGSLPQWRREMQDELSKRLRAGPTEVGASSTAGLGSVFAAIGDQHLKPGGRIALVLPAAVTTGITWERTRGIIDSKYDLEFVVTSHDAARWSFSENTDLSEVLIVARKRTGSEKRSGNCTFINLWRNPASAPQALAIAHLVSNTAIPDIQASGDAVAPLQLAGIKWGEALSLSRQELEQRNWIGGAFAQTELTRCLLGTLVGKIRLPGATKVPGIKMCSLGDLASFGPDRRDIADGFTTSNIPTAFPAFWGHKAGVVTRMEGEANKWLSPRAEAAPKRPLRDAAVLWERSGRLMIVERMRLSTQRLTAIRMQDPALSNVWWPVALHESNEQHEKALMLWLNSSLGLLVMMGLRVPTEGPWVQFKKPTEQADLGALA